MREFSSSPIEMLSSLWHNRELILATSKRDVLSRYQGSNIGLFWSVLNPVLLLTIYTFVFSVIFKSRWNADSESKTEFALVLFAGLLIFNLFAETIGRAPTLVLSNPNYVKKVVYPLDILPAAALLSTLFHTLINLGVWLVAYIIFFGFPKATSLYLPVILLPYLLLILGLSWCLAALGVYLRDISQFVSTVITLLMFITPLFYPVTALPENFRPFIYFNPLTLIVEQVRDVLFWGKAPDISMLSIYTVLSICAACLGFAWFQSTRKGFADVI